jgi:hypothetical protein
MKAIISTSPLAASRVMAGIRPFWSNLSWAIRDMILPLILWTRHFRADQKCPDARRPKS